MTDTTRTTDDRVTMDTLRTSLEFFRTAPRDEVLDELVRYGFMTEEERRRLDRDATTTPRTTDALAVIERHREEWRREFRREAKAGNKTRALNCSEAERALAIVADELAATPDPDAFDATRSPFDPVRAGMTASGYHRYNLPCKEGEDRDGLTLLYDGDVMHISIYRPDAMEWKDTTLPVNLPHDTVLSILRANGYEGGDDE